MTYDEWKANLLAKFQGIKKTSTGYQALCPAHEDQKASLSISFDNDTALLHCHAGCNTHAVVNAVNLIEADLFFKEKVSPPIRKPRIVATYDYVDESGIVLFQTVRYEPKDFRQRHKEGEKWVWNMKGVRRVLYNLPAVHKAQNVLLVAGEKDCHTAQNLGFVATTNPMGEGKWSDTYNDSLTGKEVIIIGDNDEAGRKDIGQKAQSLKSVVRSLKIIPALPGVPKKGDLADWVALDPEAHNAKALQTIIDDTPYSKEPVKDKPEWAFWTYEAGYKGNVYPVISASLYLTVLEKLQYRIFMKRGLPTVVIDTPDGMVKTDKRGRINITVKTHILEMLQEEGFSDIVDVMLLNSKYFTLDVLEMLPEISREKARQSLFSEVDTDVCFDTPIEDETHLITFQGDDWESVLLSSDNFMGISAFSGGGKSNICELFASLALAPDCELYSHIHVNVPDGLIIWYDTERSMGDCVRALKRIGRRTHVWNGNGHLLTPDEKGMARLDIKALKGVEDQTTFILEHLDSMKDKVSLVLFDGALDLVDSMNAEAEAKAFTDNLMRITKKLGCGVVVTIHGKTDKDHAGSGLGHIGKAIERKCSAFLTIRNEKNEVGRDIKRLTTDFSAGKVRNGRCVGVDDFFEWDDLEGLCHFIDYTPPDKPVRESLRERVERTLDVIFAEHKALIHKYLIQQYMNEAGVKEATAKGHIRKAYNDWQLLTKDGDYYHLASTTL